MTKKQKYYAAKKGEEKRIFETWKECNQYIHGESGVLYKSFDTREEAEEYLSRPGITESERLETKQDVLDKLNDKEMIAYVDGSNLGDGSAFSWGAVIFSREIEGCKANLSGKSDNEDFIQYRNVAGELFAAVHAINFALKNEAKKVSVYHDYSGIRHWALGEWKTKNALSKHYKKYFDSVKDKIEVNFIKVAGHTGDKYNEEADVLAKSALGIK